MNRSKLRIRQRGAVSIIAALMLAVLVTAMLLFALRDSDTAINDTLNQDDSTAALFLAESGLERAVNLLASGTACDASLISSHTMGKGGFDVTAGQTTDFDGVTALPAGQCRVQVTGRISNKNTQRTIQGVISSVAATGISFDRASNRRSSGTTSLSWNHRTSGSDRLLIVGLSLDADSGQTVTGITYNGIALSPIDAITQTDPSIPLRVEQWQLTAPPLGNHPIVVSLSANVAVVGGGVSLNGADQTGPIEAQGTQLGSDLTPSIAVITVSNDAWIVDTIASYESTVTAGSGQMVHWDRSTPGGGINLRGSGSSKGPIATAGSTIMSWTISSANPGWVIVASAVQPSSSSSSVLSWREIVQ